MPLRPCLECGTLCYRTRCADCERERNRFRGRRSYTSEWDRLSRAARQHSPYCERCGTTLDLTADHIVPLARGGTNTADNVRVLCRSCNSSKGAR